MAFVNPGYLGTRARVQRALRPRRRAAARARAARREAAAGAAAPHQARGGAGAAADRIEERRDCELTDGQRQLYLAELRRSRALVEALSGDARAASRATRSPSSPRSRACARSAAIRRSPAASPSLGSGKFDALFELLEPLLAEGHKVLVFSQFVQCLKLLQPRAARRAASRHHILTGADRASASRSSPRSRTIREPCVFLVSLKAGGTGLNLTAASYVVLFDPWWNPAVEAQAIDRTHRIGQDRTVIAYRLLTRGTIEEKIWELQQRKAALVARRSSARTASRARSTATRSRTCSTRPEPARRQHGDCRGARAARSQLTGRRSLAGWTESRRRRGRPPPFTRTGDPDAKPPNRRRRARCRCVGLGRAARMPVRRRRPSARPPS